MPCSARMTLDEKLEQLQLFADWQATDEEVREGRRRRVQPDRSGEDQPLAARRGRAVPAAHPAAVRLRHDPRLPHRVPDPARRGEQLRPERGQRGRELRRARDGGHRHQAGLQPDGGRVPRAALGAHLRGVRRGSRTSARSWPRPACMPTRAATTARRTRWWPASSTSRRTASQKAAVSTTPPTCPRSGCTTSICRRTRRRSTPAPARRCARSTRSTAFPAARTRETETDILKHQWGFDGFVESDYTAVAELRACPPVNPDNGPCGHGVAADGPQAAQVALNAGTDMEMVSTNYVDFGKQLLAQGKISMPRINDAVRRILRIKFRAGLFEHPYVDPTGGRVEATAARRSRRRARRRDQVDGAAEERQLGAAARPDQVGGCDRPARRRPARHARPVVGRGPRHRCGEPLRPASRPRTRNTTFAQACEIVDSDAANQAAQECASDAGFDAAVAAAQNARAGRARAR